MQFVEKLPTRKTEDPIFKMIFLPGFSTATQVSAVSGRGVGMDVVKTNIEKIGGTVDLSSAHGKGTTIRLRIPLTLAIVPAMIVRSNQNGKFAIPQVKLVELVRVDSSSREDQIEFLQNKPMYRLRGDLLPLVRLDEVLGQNSISSADWKKSDSINIVVLNADGEYFGLVVDEILDTADIVVKPLSRFLKSLPVFSGATIMGDGSVALILDIAGIAKVTHLEPKRKMEESFHDGATTEKRLSNDAQEFLLFKINNPSMHAIPLCLVNRLEEFGIQNIEYSGNQKVAKYRGAILPILSLNESLGYSSGLKQETSANPDSKINIIVVQRTNRLYGIQVDDIHDIVMIDGQIDDSVRDRDGLLGNILNGDEVIAVVDALGVIERQILRMKSGEGRSTGQAAMDELKEKAKQSQAKKIRVLFAEDVAFFRRQVSKVLGDAGMDVVVAEDGSKALKVLESSRDGEFNLILSDIEMPNMNGLQFAQEVRKNSRYEKIPMIALTTRFTDRDIDLGFKAGFNLYLEKLNPDKLLNGIHSLFPGGTS